MFRKFRVQNFMCLKDVTVELEPLTVFAGPSSSGKSALFKALGCFTRLLYYPVSGGRTGEFNVEFGTTLDDVVWKGDSSHPISFEVWLQDNSDDKPDYTLVLRRDYTGWKVEKEEFLYEGNWLDTGAQPFEFSTSRGTKSWSSPYGAPLAYLTYPYRLDGVAAPFVQPLQDLRMRLGQARRYRPSASDIASFVRVAATGSTTGRSSKGVDVDEAGRGLAVALRDLLTGDRATFTDVENELQRLHGHISGMSFRSDWRGVGIFYGTDRAAEVIPASLESDGVLLTTFLLWRLYSAAPNLKVCLEEPENGVHLWGMSDRYQLLRQFVAAENPRKLQILVATHSRDFLNAIRSRSEIFSQVRVVEISSDGGTAIHPLAHFKQVDSLLDEFRDQMGDLWWSRRLADKW